MGKAHDLSHILLARQIKGVLVINDRGQRRCPGLEYNPDALVLGIDVHLADLGLLQNGPDLVKILAKGRADLGLFGLQVRGEAKLGGCLGPHGPVVLGQNLGNRAPVQFDLLIFHLGPGDAGRRVHVNAGRLDNGLFKVLIELRGGDLVVKIHLYRLDRLARFQKRRDLLHGLLGKDDEFDIVLADVGHHRGTAVFAP